MGDLIDFREGLAEKIKSDLIRWYYSNDPERVHALVKQVEGLQEEIMRLIEENHKLEDRLALRDGAILRREENVC